MTLAQERHGQDIYLVRLKSFFVWSFTLTVCLLVVGFPVVFLLAIAAVLAMIVLQAVLPVSAVLIVVGSILGANALIVLWGATILTFKGIHPEAVRWLYWLHSEPAKDAVPSYASCPLTCELVQHS